MIIGVIRVKDIYYDNILKVLIICRRVILVLYYIIDYIIWVVRLGFYKVILKDWFKFQVKFWVIVFVFGFFRNLYEILNLIFVLIKKYDGGEESNL